MLDAREMECARVAALMMLEYEAWLHSAPGHCPHGYQGTTGSEVIDTAARGDVRKWADIAHFAIDIAQEMRGCTAVQARYRAQKARQRAA